VTYTLLALCRYFTTLFFIPCGNYKNKKYKEKKKKEKKKLKVKKAQSPRGTVLVWVCVEVSLLIEVPYYFE
jgi:hypothetical protein